MTIAVGDVVQIDPASDDRFGGCFLTVSEVKRWGVVGYVRVPGQAPGLAYYRLNFEHLHPIGVAEWKLADAE